MAERWVAVAYSGGRDSTALLHATLHRAAAMDVNVLAVHVHHGLSPNADAWLAHCESQCRRWARRGLPISFSASRIAHRPTKGESVEAWARTARYQALRDVALAAGADVVLLAHHRSDQAETFLLQALRGAGVAGLSGMPSSVLREGVTWKRPWLHKSRADIEAYIRRHRLKHIDDESNDDPRFARNRLRIDVWPALRKAFPDAESTLSTAAEWAQEAHQALKELAEIDLAKVQAGSALDVSAWLELSHARRSNSLRAWLHARLGAAPSASLLVRLLDELPARRSARWPVAAAAELGAEMPVELRLYRGSLRCDSVEPSLDPTLPETRLSITSAGVYELAGWSGAILVEEARDVGVPMAWLAHLELRRRAGGEKFQSGIGRPPRSLKKQFQDSGVAMWHRAGPLVYSGDQLIFVPGLGLDARVLGVPGQALATLQWLPSSTAG